MIGIGTRANVRDSTRSAPIPEAPMPAMSMLRMSLPGRTRSTACPRRRASDNCLVNCSIDLTIALRLRVILDQR